MTHTEHTSEGIGVVKDASATTSRADVGAGASLGLDPLEGLTPASRRIVEAAAAILAEEGPGAATVERIAQVAKVNKWTIRNNFGSRNTVVDRAFTYLMWRRAQDSAETVRALSRLQGDSGIQHAAAAIRFMARHHPAIEYFNVAPMAVKKPALRELVCANFDWWASEVVRWLERENAPERAAPVRASVDRATGHVVMAVIDGLILQDWIYRDDRDILDAALDAVPFLLEHGVPADNEDREAFVPDTSSVPDPLEGLTPASRRIVEAAADVLALEGLGAVTMEKVAQHARVNRWTIRNNFGTMASVVGKAFDYRIWNLTLASAGEVSRLHGGAGIGGMAAWVRLAVRAQAPYYNVVPIGVRDDDLRRRIRLCYDWWVREVMRCLGDGQTGAKGSEAGGRGARGNAHLIVAMIDGLILQNSIYRDDSRVIESALDAVPRLLENGVYMPAG